MWFCNRAGVGIISGVAREFADAAVELAYGANRFDNSFTLERAAFIVPSIACAVRRRNVELHKVDVLADDVRVLIDLEIIEV
jgi:hypothetical protein